MRETILEMKNYAMPSQAGGPVLSNIHHLYVLVQQAEMAAAFMNPGNEWLGRKKEPVTFFIGVGPGFQFIDQFGIGIVDHDALEAALEGVFIVT